METIMYKVIIEEVAGDLKKVVTLETEDVELVKSLLEIGNVKSVDSDIANLNIDAEWQELWQWYQNKKKEDATWNFLQQNQKRYDIHTTPLTVTC